jgi:hypothetical protein
MKKLIDLTISDLIKFNVWETWIENETEYVKPSSDKEVLENSNIGHIVLTDFKLKNNKELLGFCAPQDPSGLDYIQPVIFSEKGQVEFWRDGGWTIEDKKVAFEKLGVKGLDLFPIHFKTKVKTNNEFYSGTIWDFNK